MRAVLDAVTAVGFDLDYTLWDQDAFFASFFAAAAGEYGRRLGCGRRRFAQVCAGALRRLTPAHPALFDQALHQMGAWDPRLVAELVERFRGHRPPAQPYPGTERTLRLLREAGFRLFLVSDGHVPSQRHKVAALGLSHRFDHLVFTGDLPEHRRKPSPDPFLLACARLEVAPERCLYVGDHPARDFPGPKSLGMLTAGVPTGPFAASAAPPELRPDFQLAALEDLPGLLTGDLAGSTP
jgi:putative hydrolase of the HAD superfamily